MDLAALRSGRLAEIALAQQAGRRLVGYLCSYAPVELIRAAGAVPVRLALGGAGAEAAGTKYLRADACSFCKSCLGNFESDPLHRQVDAVVAVSTCDMMRRLPESIEQHFGKSTFTLYLPRTAEPLPHRLAEFERQLGLMGDWLAGLTGIVPAPRLATEVAAQNRLRQAMQRLDRARAAVPPRLRTSRLLDVAELASLLAPEAAVALAAAEPDEVRPGRRPRLLLGGSILTSGDRWLLQLVESRADVVGDILCTGARSFTGDVPAGEPLAALARYYYTRVPCAHRRPNGQLHEHAVELARERQADGFIYKTLLYCDAWSFEARRLQRSVGLPFLHLDTDYGREHREQARTRVEAFLELLA